MKKETRTSIIDDSIAMAYLMNIATRAAADESFEAMKQGKLNPGATIEIARVVEEGPNLVFFFILWDTVHPNLQTAITISAQVNHAETSPDLRPSLSERMQEWELEQRPVSKAEIIDLFSRNQQQPDPCFNPFLDDTLQTFSFAWVVDGPNGEHYTTGSQIEASTREEAEARALDMLENSYAQHKGWRRQALSETEAQEWHASLRAQDEEQKTAPDTIPLAFRRAFDEQPSSGQRVTEADVEAFARRYICEHCLIADSDITKVSIYPLCDHGAWYVWVDANYHDGPGQVWLIIGMLNDQLEVTMRDE